MSLVLVTGPANAAKAGIVFARYRELLPGRPLLVVPTSADAEHYARELATRVVVGTEVVTFDGLIRALAAALGLRGRPLRPPARERVLRSAIRDVELSALAAPAAAPGFAAALGELFAELGRELVGPGRFISALRRWRGDAFAEELGRLHGAYHRRLERLGATDPETFAHAVLDGLRADPTRWDGRPVLWYGFDDLTRAQFDAVEALAGRAGAPVIVALPWEAGRAALAGCARTVEELRPLAAEHVRAPEHVEHYAPSSREPLHHLERTLFEAHPARVAPGNAVRLLEAGGTRAEAELVAAEVLRLVAEGAPPEEVAVVTRTEAERPLLEQVLQRYGVPVSAGGRLAFPQTRIGAGVVAAARAAGPAGSPADLVAWLRTPGRLADPDAADRLEAAALRAQAASIADALRVWRRAAPADAALADDVRAALAALREAGAAGGAALLDALADEADAVWAAPHARRAVVLDPEDAVDARAAAELRAAVGELRRLAEADRSLLRGPADVLEALASVQVRRPAGAGVLVGDPLAIRARRFRAVVVCGLQEGAFPRRPPPDPFLPDDERRALAAATDLRLPLREDALARERALFYACVSRPQETLVLAFRSATEEGDPLQSSPFVDDVRAVFTDALWECRRRRLLGDVTWAPRDAPTAHELRRAWAVRHDEESPPPLAGPVTAEVRALLAGHAEVSARELETFATCPTRWLIERVLRPARAEPDSPYLRRGAIEHALLERTLRRLRERLGSAALHRESLPAALEELAGAVEELRATASGARAHAALRGAQLALARVLGHEADEGPGLEPAHLEWTPEPLDLGTIRVTGRVDRVDVGGRRALVRDYKRRPGPPGARWAQDRRIQVALYALAVREQLGLEPVAAVMQPLTGSDLRPRGLVREGAPAGAVVDTDRLGDEEFDAALEALRRVATDAGLALREGRISACPARCTPAGACAYPGICRAGEGGEEE